MKSPKAKKKATKQLMKKLKTRAKKIQEDFYCSFRKAWFFAVSENNLKCQKGTEKVS